MRDIKVRPLTISTFEAFGRVISTRPGEGTKINNGTAERFDRLAIIDTADEGGQAAISVFRARPILRPVKIDMMECHPLGSQSFIPMSTEPYLVVVAPPGEQLRDQDILAFKTNGHQGVHFFKGTWHHPLLALYEQQFTVVDRTGSGDNLLEVRLAEPIMLLDDGSK